MPKIMPRIPRRRRSDAATLKLMEAQIPHLRRYARYMCSSADVADDTVQDCLVRAINRLDTWQRGTNMRAWLLKILRNAYFSRLRSERRGARAIDSIDTELPSPDGDPELALELNEVQRAFQDLQPWHREILFLVAIEGLTYAEAATILKVAIGTVRSRLSRARDALERSLYPPEPDHQTAAAANPSHTRPLSIHHRHPFP